MTQLKIIWEDDALKLLMDRDRYTRSAIQEEFRSDPQRDAFPLDPQNPQEGEFLTQVSNKRFTVWWSLDSARQMAIVHAVLPLPITDVEKQSPQLKEHVHRAARQAIKEP